VGRQTPPLLVVEAVPSPSLDRPDPAPPQEAPVEVEPEVREAEVPPEEPPTPLAPEFVVEETTSPLPTPVAGRPVPPPPTAVAVAAAPPAAAEAPDPAPLPAAPEAVPPRPAPTPTAASAGAYVPPAVVAAVNRPPVYPRRAVRRGLTGRVELLVRVGPDGRPAAVEVHRSSGHDVLDRAALEAVRTWEFRPATRDGVPVSGSLLVPVRFGLTDA